MCMRCLNTTNCPIFNMQVFRYCLWTSILDCFGQLVSPPRTEETKQAECSIHQEMGQKMQDTWSQRIQSVSTYKSAITVKKTTPWGGESEKHQTRWTCSIEPAPWARFTLKCACHHSLGLHLMVRDRSLATWWWHTTFGETSQQWRRENINGNQIFLLVL